METNWRYDDGRGNGYDEDFDMLIWGAGDGPTDYGRPSDSLRFPSVANSNSAVTASAEVMM